MTKHVQGQGLDLNKIIAEMKARSAPLRLDSIAAAAVANTAQKIACSLLESRGNVLSPAHREAIGIVTREFAELAAGKLQGKRAYALPTGMGKTTAAAAFIAALYRLGHHHVAITVAASQVHALGKFREQLLELGVPDSSIGIKHTVHSSGIKNTGDESRVYQLVTHVRARNTVNLSGTSQLAIAHEGRERALCIYDETLWRADTASMPIKEAMAALAYLREYLSVGHPLAQYLAEVKSQIAEHYEKAEQRASGVALELHPISDAERQAWIAEIERDPRLSRNPLLSDDLVRLLQLADEPLRVINTGQGKGLISVRSAISGLQNVAILDASTPIRELVKLDQSVQAAQLPPGLKSFENVRVSQYLTAGGRSSLQAEKRPAQLAQEVTGIVQAALAADPAANILIFTFKDRGNDKPADRIRAQLVREGIDVNARNAEGKLRFEFLTWGQQEGLNGYEHCNTVVLAGVLTRDSIGIAAAIKGQTADLRQPTPDALIDRMIASEIGHCVYQAASRGGCRVMLNGKAQAMTLHILHKDANLKGLLEPVMPRAVWEYPAPTYLPPSKHTGKANAMLAMIRENLANFPPDQPYVSSRELKERAGLDPKNGAIGKQFARAIGQLTANTDGWERSGWGVRRAR